MERFGRIDVLIISAGITTEKGWWWNDPDPLRVLRVNLVSPIELVRPVLPDMRARRGGHVVNAALHRATGSGRLRAGQWALLGTGAGLIRGGAVNGL